MSVRATAPVFVRRESRAVRGLLRPVLLLFTAVLLAFVGLILDSTTLVTAAVAIALVVFAAAITTSIALWRVDVERTADASEVVEDSDLRLQFAVRGLPRLPVRIEARGADGAWRVLEPGGGALGLPLPVRGPMEVGATRLRLSDDFGIIRRTLRAGTPHLVLVLPDVVRGLARLPEGGRGGDPEPDGLRAYRPGTPVGRIHWASLARGADLQERAVASTAPADLPLLVVDTSGAPDAATVDWVARAAAGAIRDLAARGGCRVLVPGTREVLLVTETEGWPQAHRALAHMDASRPQGAPAGARLRIDASGAPDDLRRDPLPDGVVALTAGT